MVAFEQVMAVCLCRVADSRNIKVAICYASSGFFSHERPANWTTVFATQLSLAIDPVVLFRGLIKEAFFSHSHSLRIL